tara:strand:+ start:1434 stop:1667 length:234 start_codon:yes stop_codon:yes gene_type:complete
MSNLPTLKAKKLIKFIEKLGFVLVRQKGSHCFYRHADGRTTVIPVHQREDIGKGLFLEILKDIKISPGDFLKLWKKI